jgi:hypothetical protein
VTLLNRSKPRLNLQEALAILSQKPQHNDLPLNESSPNSRPCDWLLIFDGVDDVEISIQSFIPSCSHGSIIITTRDRNRGQLSIEGHLELEGMTSAEAEETIRMASGRGKRRTHQINTAEETAALRMIAHNVNYLPLTLVQAGSHMFQAKDDPQTYLSKLQSNLKKILSQPATHQRDRPRSDQDIKHYRTIFAAYNSSRRSLSPKVQKFLSILAFYYSGEFPLDLIEYASQASLSLQVNENGDTADRNDPIGPFTHQHPKAQYMERGSHFKLAIELLKDVFCDPKGNFDQLQLDEMIISLQNYSLVTVHSPRSDSGSDGNGGKVLVMQSLVQTWILDEFFSSEGDKENYSYALVRLLACGACGKKGQFDRFLVSHLSKAQMIWEQVHVNDFGAFGHVCIRSNELSMAHKIRKHIYFTMTKYVEELGQSRTKDHLKTLAKMVADLAETYACREKYTEARRLIAELVIGWPKLTSKDSDQSLAALESLAAIDVKLKNFDNALKLRRNVLKHLLNVRAPPVKILKARARIADSLMAMGSQQEAGFHRDAIYEGAEKYLPADHVELASAGLAYAESLLYRGRLDFAEVLAKRARKVFVGKLPEEHPDILKAEKVINDIQIEREREAEKIALFNDPPGTTTQSVVPEDIRQDKVVERLRPHSTQPVVKSVRSSSRGMSHVIYLLTMSEHHNSPSIWI